MILPFVHLIFVQHERHASPLSPKSTRHRPQRLLMVCLLPPPAPVSLPLYLRRYRTCCFDVALLVASAHFIFLSRSSLAPILRRRARCSNASANASWCRMTRRSSVWTAPPSPRSSFVFAFVSEMTDATLHFIPSSCTLLSHFFSYSGNVNCS